MTRSIKRRGFTLVELLVVTGLIVFLAAVAMLTVPGIMQKNRTVDASTQVDVWLQIARARAQRDKLPRGLRLIIDTSKPAPALGQPDQRLFVTEVQYTEAPPVFVANPNPPYPNGLTGSVPHVLSPRVEFDYTLTAGAISGRQCTIRGLNQEQAEQIITNSGQQSRLWLPTLGTWHNIIATNPAALPAAPDTAFPGSYAVSLRLDQYPDAQMGIATQLRTYHFGIYLPPRPLLGEAAMQLPLNTCIDLNIGVSSPDGNADLTNLAGPRDYDILFAPSGQLAYTASTLGAGHVFLWIREPRKYAAGMNPLTQTALEAGGEQMIVAIKSRGITGVAPVYWPDATITSPYYLAQKAVAGP